PRNTSPLSRIRTMPTLALYPSASIQSLMRLFTGCHAAEQGRRNLQCVVISRPAPTLRFSFLLILAAGIACCSLVAGSTDIGMRAAIAALFGDLAEPARTVVLDLRLPRVLSAFGIGALLAVSGVLLQALFRNPLADSYVLGVSGGSALGALLALLAGGSLWLVQGAAATGAILATLLVLALAHG